MDLLAFGLQSFSVTVNTAQKTCKQHSAIADLHTLQFTVAHTLGFSVSTSRCLVPELNTGIVTSP
jgi:hypothetical protein